MTLDLGFADIRTYPPDEMPGFIVLRLARHDKQHVVDAIERTLVVLEHEPIEHQLWIVGETQIRIRGSAD